MNYHDVNYYVKYHNEKKLSSKDKIEDVYIVRTDHYCVETGEYWKNKQDESIYLKVKTKEGLSKQVFLAKNTVNEYEANFETPSEEIKFYNKVLSQKFYNFVDVYETLTNTQAIKFLNIMTEHRGDYDYNLQYCDQDKVVKGIVTPNFKSHKQTVYDAHNNYLKVGREELQKEENYQQEMKSMLEGTTNGNVIAFPSKGIIKK